MLAGKGPVTKKANAVCIHLLAKGIWSGQVHRDKNAVLVSREQNVGTWLMFRGKAL